MTVGQTVNFFTADRDARTRLTDASDCHTPRDHGTGAWLAVRQARCVVSQGEPSLCAAGFALRFGGVALLAQRVDTGGFGCGPVSSALQASQTCTEISVGRYALRRDVT